MLRKSFLKRTPASGEMSLQITSMADIFMILLIFLLKSYASGAVELTSSSGINVPKAEGGATGANALKVEVAENTVLVEGAPVATIKNYRFDTAELTGNGASKTLSTALEKERQRQLLIAQKNPGVKVDSRIIVLADQKVPYTTIKSVLAAAAVNGYTDFKLAVASTH